VHVYTSIGISDWVFVAGGKRTMIVDSLSQIMTETVHDHESVHQGGLHTYPLRRSG
jgi:hypothetical protein